MADDTDQTPDRVALEGTVAVGTAGSLAPLPFSSNDPLPRRVSNAVPEFGGWVPSPPRTEPPIVLAQQTLDQKLAQDPASIRDAVRDLVKAVQEQINHLNASKPNDPEGLTRHDNFVAFLETLARGLSELADALDQAIAAPADQQPMFLGMAGQITRQLKTGLEEFVEKNRTYIAGYTVRIGLVAAAFKLLCFFGLGADAAGLASTLLSVSIPGKK